MASPFRCDNGLVTVGEHAFQVTQKCGAPDFQEDVGYTLTSDGKRELRIEHWIYGPKGGRYHLLIFEGGFLKKIGQASKTAPNSKSTARFEERIFAFIEFEGASG